MQPNERELERIRKLKKKREAEAKKAKIDKWRDDYWLINPM